MKQAGCAYDKNLCAGLCQIPKGFLIAGAVHLDQILVSLLFLQYFKFVYLIQHFPDKGLSCKAGVHGHYRHLIKQMDVVLYVGYRGGRVQHNTHLAPQGADFVHNTERIRVNGLRMRADESRPRLGQGFDKIIRGCDHQMAVQGDTAHRTDGFAEIRGQGDILHIVSVHNIHMVKISPCI